MIVGVPKEIKNHEYRVGLTPDQVKDLCMCGHQVLIQRKAGEAIGFLDDHYAMAGALWLMVQQRSFLNLR